MIPRSNPDVMFRRTNPAMGGGMIQEDGLERNRCQPYLVIFIAKPVQKVFIFFNYIL